MESAVGDGPGASRRVSVVVPHYHDLKSLGLCLDALSNQTFPRERFEIIVADNASPEEREAIATVIDGRAQLVTVEERGAGPARNGGVLAASGEILAFTDCDCVPAPGWLAAGLAALERYDVVGGAMEVLTDDPPSPSEAFEREFAFDNKAYVERKGFTVTANLFCRRRVFDAVGGFRVGVSEDFDWCARATALGFKLGYAPQAVVGHPARRNWEELVKKWRRLNRETYALYSGTGAGRMRWLVRSLALPLSAVAHTPRVLLSRSLRGPGERLGALAVLYRLRVWRCWDSLRVAVGGGS